MTDNEIEVGSLKTYVDTEDKAHFVFEGVVESDIPLLTNSQNFAEAINELFTSGTGATYNGNFRAVIDDNSGAITIVVGEIPEEYEEEQYTDYSYSYTAVKWSDEIVTETTTPEGSIKTTQTFEKRSVTELYNGLGELIMYTDYNADTGEVKGYYDGDGLPIHLAEWRV